MKVDANNIKEYINNIPEARKPFIKKLRDIILKNIPEGFHEELNYGMVGYVVPHDIYPAGYHANPETPLPFLSLASQKNHIALYHMGINAIPELKEWFVNEYPNHCKYKIDISKSCIRFKKLEDIPYELITELIKKVSVENWIEVHEDQIKR